MFNDDRDKYVDYYAKYVSKGKVQLYQDFQMDIVPGSREGVIFEDINGKKFYNCHSNGGVFNLGHRNKEIINVLNNAVKDYDIGNHHLLSAGRALLGEKLAKVFPGNLNKVVYGVGGGEAIDLAIKLSRGYTGRYKILYAKGGYHGHTGLALAAGERKYKEPFLPDTSDFVEVEYGNSKDVISKLDSNTAAVIFETVEATGGIVIPPENFFGEVKKATEENETLFIIDEVQTGWGRTGKLWGFEHFNVEPDIVVLGKGMSGGIYPISATIYNEKLESFFLRDPFIPISTFGGSEIGVLVAMKVLEISDSPQFLEHVNNMAKLFYDGVNNIINSIPGIIVEFRQLGLMMGLKIKDEITSMMFLKYLFDNGIYTVYSGNDPSVIQLLPPLIINEGEVFEVLNRIEKTTITVRELVDG